ncbi:MAG TPA: cysteine--tRNA ligase [Candidatus Nanoarchaeia archaeon]|nr:cysteine--tRNA ligase [Candidatus Nanoarchaeia archaeon]
MLKIYNTLTRNKEEFEPIKKGQVGLYTCGPTVYDYSHIGNYRTYIFEDMLKRVLIADGFKVKHVMNITDVGHLTSDADTGEDKVEKRSKERGMTAWELSEFYTKSFFEDMKRLNLIKADITCKATDHIKEQIEMVETLEKKGLTYKTEDGIYFDTSKLPDYGRMATVDISQIEAGKRVEMGGKRNPTDFALWKFSPKDQKRQMEWKSPWSGTGFPGWHIECSAMASKYLGKQFDIHCGGIDLANIHHINEIAQSEGCFGIKPWVNYWMHGEFLLLNSEKMAKSKGGFITIKDLEEKGFEPMIYKFFTYTAHYRKQLNFTFEILEGAKQGFERLKRKVLNIKEAKGKANEGFYARFMDHMNDDLNMPNAMSVVWEILESKLNKKDKYATILKMDEILGLDISNWKEESVEVPDEIQKLIDDREKARKNKDWKKADEIRKDIIEKGYVLEDINGKIKVNKA